MTAAAGVPTVAVAAGTATTRAKPAAATKWKRSARKDQAALQAQCLDFTRHVIAHWHPRPHYGYGQKTEPCELVPALVLFDEPKLIQDFLDQVMTRDASVEVTTPLLKV